MVTGGYRIFSPTVPNVVSALVRGQLRAVLVRNYLKYLALELQYPAVANSNSLISVQQVRLAGFSAAVLAPNTGWLGPGR